MLTKRASLRQQLNGSTIINQGHKLDTSKAPYVVLITPEELETLEVMDGAGIKSLAVKKGVPPDVVNGKFRASQTENGLLMEWERG